MCILKIDLIISRTLSPYHTRVQKALYRAFEIILYHMDNCINFFVYVQQ